MMLLVHQCMQNVNLGVMMTKQWTTEIQEDPDDPGSLILQFPDDLLAEAGWAIGDVLIWEVQEDQSIIIRKK